MLLWFADLLNVTEKVTIHRPNVSTLLSNACIRGDHSRAFLTPRLSSHDDCFSSQMDSPESGDTDDVSSENDSLRTYTQKQKVRPKQLPFPASLLEGKSDDVIVSDINVSGKLSFSFQFRN